MIESLITAIQFLTTLPVWTGRDTAGVPLGRAAGWFSYVGGLIGLITAGVFLAAQYAVPRELAAVFTVIVWILLTGGLHLDGVADCCDGLFVAADKERRLEIMHDPHHGTFGVIGLVLVILLKAAALFAVPDESILFGLLFTCALSRWLLLPAGRLPGARPDGLGAQFSSGLDAKAFIWGLAPVIAAAYFTGWLSVPLLALVSVFTFLLLRFAQKRLGGITGDVLGCLVELSEVVLLVGFCAAGVLV